MAEIKKLDQLLLDLIRDESMIEWFLKDIQERSRILRAHSFRGNAYDALMNIGADSITEFARNADQVLRNLPPSQFTAEQNEDGTKVILGSKNVAKFLEWKDFNPRFSNVFERFLTKEVGRPKSDLIVVHLNSGVQLEEIPETVKYLDTIFNEFLKIHYETFYNHANASKRPRLLHLREYRYGSAEIFLSVAPEVAVVLALFLENPVAQGLFVNCLYDLAKHYLRQGYRFAYGRLLPDAKETEEEKPVELEIDNPEGKTTLTSSLIEKAAPFYEKTVVFQNFIAIANIKFITWGTEEVVRIDRSHITERRFTQTTRD